VIDVLVSARRDAKAVRRFFARAIGTTKVTPVEVITDQAGLLDDGGGAAPSSVAPHRSARQQRVGADHGRLTARLHPMLEPEQDPSARIAIAGHGLVQNLRRGHYELGVEELATRRWRSRSTSWPW
jgi:transposase, IS6 family